MTAADIPTGGPSLGWQILILLFGFLGALIAYALVGGVRAMRRAGELARELRRRAEERNQ